jgi:hypothetical protein
MLILALKSLIKGIAEYKILTAIASIYLHVQDYVQECPPEHEELKLARKAALMTLLSNQGQLDHIA